MYHGLIEEPSQQTIDSVGQSRVRPIQAEEIAKFRYLQPGSRTTRLEIDDINIAPRQLLAFTRDDPSVNLLDSMRCCHMPALISIVKERIRLSRKATRSILKMV